MVLNGVAASVEKMSVRAGWCSTKNGSGSFIVVNGDVVSV